MRSMEISSTSSRVRFLLGFRPLWGFIWCVSFWREPQATMSKENTTNGGGRMTRLARTLVGEILLPIGVVIGPFRAIPFRRTEARVASGSGVPAVSITSTPAS